MTFLICLLLAFSLPLITGIYVALNIVIVTLLMRYGPQLLRAIATPSRRSLRIQFQSLSSGRIWTTVVLHAVAVGGLFLLLRRPLTLIAISNLILGYIFLISVVTLSLMMQISFFRKLWDDAAIKLGMAALSIYLGFFAKGYAASWVEQVIGTSAANAGFTLLAATVFLLCLVVAVALLIVSGLFELVLLITPVIWGSKWRNPKVVGLLLLALSSLVASMFGAITALSLPGTRLGSLMLSATAFEFDASTAIDCELDKTERMLSTGNAPSVKALHLISSQEKAILVERSIDFSEPFVLKELPRNDAANVHVIRVTACYTTGEK